MKSPAICGLVSCLKLNENSLENSPICVCTVVMVTALCMHVHLDALMILSNRGVSVGIVVVSCFEALETWIIPCLSTK